MRERLEMNRPGRSGINSELQATGQRTGRRRLVCLIACLISSLFRLATAYASGGGGEEGPNWFGFAWRLLNFLVLIGILYWLLASKIRDFLTGRREGIKTALSEAVSAQEAAEKKFREYSEKLDKATEEIEQLGEMIRSQGLVEKERILEEARKAAEKMAEKQKVQKWLPFLHPLSPHEPPHQSKGLGRLS